MADLGPVALHASGSRDASRLSSYAVVGGLGLAIVMLVVFHAMVQGQVLKARTQTLPGVTAVAQPDPGCRDAGVAGANDLCMLEVAVSPRLVHPAGARTRGSSRLDARAD